MSAITYSNVEGWCDKSDYGKFCDHFLRAVVNIMLSKLSTVSDEAFALLVCENNMERWIDMYARTDRKSSEVIPKYTNGGRSQVGNGSSQRCKGWSVEGTRRYNAIFRYVAALRASTSRKDFEVHYLEDKKLEFEKERALKKKRSVGRAEEDEEEIVHSLWGEFADHGTVLPSNYESEDEDNENTAVGNDEQRRKDLYEEPDEEFGSSNNNGVEV